MPLLETEPIFFDTEDAFDSWLDAHLDAQDVWVGFFKKSTGRLSMTWPALVDVALCHGWIDGIRKSIDAESYKIRFTPRRPGSVWRAVNVEKVNLLMKQGDMRAEGLAAFAARKDQTGYSVAKREGSLSSEFENRLKSNHKVWAFFSSADASYKRDAVWWVMSAKKDETRARRLDVLIASSEEGLRVPVFRKK